MEILGATSKRPWVRAGYWATIFLLCLGGLLPPPLYSAEETNEAQQYSEHDIKAAYLLNFIKYVEWPDDAFERDDSPFRLGLLGGNPFGDALGELIAATAPDQRKITIQQSDNIADLKTCHLLFFVKNETEHRAALSQLAKLPVLTVGEQQSFTEMGGIINFVLVDAKVRFEISTKTAKKHDLKISSRLLKVSHKVYK